MSSPTGGAQSDGPPIAAAVPVVLAPNAPASVARGTTMHAGEITTAPGTTAVRPAATYALRLGAAPVAAPSSPMVTVVVLASPAFSLPAPASLFGFSAPPVTLPAAISLLVSCPIALVQAIPSTLFSAKITAMDTFGPSMAGFSGGGVALTYECFV